MSNFSNFDQVLEILFKFFLNILEILSPLLTCALVFFLFVKKFIILFVDLPFYFFNL